MTTDAPVRDAQSPGRPETNVPGMNLIAVRSIYTFEMSRFFRTWIQSVISPVLSTSLYFVVFGAAIGGRITEIEGVSYGSFIVPGLIMLMILTQSVSNGSLGIFFPKFLGTIYELLSAPVSSMEIVLGYVGAAASKSLILGIVVLMTAGFFVPIRIDHPVWMLFFLVSTAVAFSMLGFIIGIVVKAMDQLQTVPLLIIMPLTFLGGVFYPLSVLPGIWQTISLFNPIVYLISGFRWSFYSVADVDIAISLGATLALIAVELAIVTWIFRTGYRLKS